MDKETQEKYNRDMENYYECKADGVSPAVVRRSNLYNSKIPSKDYCGRCKNICVSIHCNEHTVCGLHRDVVHWYNVCSDFEFVNKRWFIHVGNSIVDNYYKD